MPLKRMTPAQLREHLGMNTKTHAKWHGGSKYYHFLDGGRRVEAQSEFAIMRRAQAKANKTSRPVVVYSSLAPKGGSRRMMHERVLPQAHIARRGMGKVANSSRGEKPVATKRAKPAAKRTRNVAAGFTTGKGKSAKFTPYRSSPDYDPKRLSSGTAGKAAEVKLAAKRKRQYTTGMKKAVAKMKNPLPVGKWTAVDKVKVRSDGSIQIMIRPGR